LYSPSGEYSWDSGERRNQSDLFNHQKLAGKRRNVLMLIKYHGLKNKEVAEILGISVPFIFCQSKKLFPFFCLTLHVK